MEYSLDKGFAKLPANSSTTIIYDEKIYNDSMYLKGNKN